MLQAIQSAVLGDDKAGEDPTVRRLEEMAASMLGKEAAILLTSGTMGNLVGVMAHTQRGQEIIVERDAHIFTSEAGWTAAIANVTCVRVPGQMGYPSPDDIEAAIRPGRKITAPTTGLICLENSHTRCGGTVITPEQTAAVGNVARKHGVPVHLDGARVFNAAVALEADVRALVKDVDSVTFCLSKGLSCPAGALLCGTRSYIDRARRLRMVLGGALRQAGIIAAPGIVALQTMIDRLQEDHQNAQALAQGLAQIEGLKVDLEAVQTNMVLVDVSGLGLTSSEFARCLADNGVLVSTPHLVRLVTHRHIKRRHVARAVEMIDNAVTRIRSG
jgi:threonine aldolase